MTSLKDSANEKQGHGAVSLNESVPQKVPFGHVPTLTPRERTHAINVDAGESEATTWIEIRRSRLENKFFTRVVQLAVMIQ